MSKSGKCRNKEEWRSRQKTSEGKLEKDQEQGKFWRAPWKTNKGDGQGEGTVWGDLTQTGWDAGNSLFALLL